MPEILPANGGLNKGGIFCHLYFVLRGLMKKKKKKKTQQGVTLFDQYKVYRYTVALKGGIGNPSNPPITHSYRQTHIRGGWKGPYPQRQTTVYIKGAPCREVVHPCPFSQCVGLGQAPSVSMASAVAA